MGLIGTLIVGLIAGWIAEKVTKSNHGLLTNLIVGVIGAFLGGFVADFADIQVGPGWLPQILVASLGAILFLIIWQAIRGRR